MKKKKKGKRQSVKKISRIQKKINQSLKKKKQECSQVGN